MSDHTSPQQAGSKDTEAFFLQLRRKLTQRRGGLPGFARLMSALGPHDIHRLAEAVAAPETSWRDVQQWFDGLAQDGQCTVLQNIGRAVPRAEWALECFLPHRGLPNLEAFENALKDYNSRRSGLIDEPSFRQLLVTAKELMTNEYLQSDQYLNSLAGSLLGGSGSLSSMTEDSTNGSLFIK